MTEYPLDDIFQRLNSIPVLEQKMIRLESRMQDCQSRVEILEQRLQVLTGEREKLEKESFSKLFQRLIGLHHGKLTKKDEQLLAAKLELEKEKEHLQDLRDEKTELSQRISLLSTQKAALEEQMQKREKEILAGAESELFEAYCQVVHTSKTTGRQLIETEEALEAARKVKDVALEALAEVKDLEQWADADIWGGSSLLIPSRALKKIDQAQGVFNRLTTQIKDFERELSEVNLAEPAIFSRISSASHMVEFWFDNVFSQNNLKVILGNGQGQLRALVAQMDEIITKLSEMSSNHTDSLESLQKEKATLLLSCGQNNKTSRAEDWLDEE